MINLETQLSIPTLLKAFKWRVSFTWLLIIIETTFFAAMPLLIGWSIDGLLNDDWTSFQHLIAVLAALLTVAIGRRAYDTRAYGSMRVELGKAQVARSPNERISVLNARVLMGRELVDFLEESAPQAMTALVQVIAAIVILLSFHGTLALSTGGAAVVMLILYALFAKRFFDVNSALNEQTEAQVSAIESRDIKTIAAHFTGLRRQEVRLSDTESVVYGLIFFVLLSLLAFNLWFGASQIGASAGEIFAIVTYSLEFLQSAVALPYALQRLTRLKEITQRINRPQKEITPEDDAGHSS